MKTYEVELRRTSYVIVTVQAEDDDAAQAGAWREIERGYHEAHECANWEIESIEELTNENK